MKLADVALLVCVCVYYMFSVFLSSLCVLYYNHCTISPVAIFM